MIRADSGNGRTSWRPTGPGWEVGEADAKTTETSSGAPSRHDVVAMGVTLDDATSQPAVAVSTPTAITGAPARPGPIPSLDGLRAIAVIIVLVSHAGFGDTIPGGLGVTIFFFLSGFLITTLLLDERNKAGRINIRHFYQRRAFRLLPPLFVTLAIAYTLVALGLLGGGASLGGLSSQVFYFANYYTIFVDHGGTTPDGTGILWSLAVEEHFYILYPLVMFALFRFVNVRRVAIVLFSTLCVAALLWRWWLVTRPGFDMLRTYYATDTRFDSILFGCILAFWRNPARLPMDRRQPLMKPVDWLVLSAGVALLLATILYRGADFRETLRYTLQGIALMPIFWYAIRAATRLPFATLNTKLLIRIGVLSYGVYLSHFIILDLIAQNVHVQIPNIVRAFLALALACAFAALLDRYVDPYFRRRRAALH
jgi:peptidoglycan/LPS O-acetylase OafA/YrhL